MKLHLFGCPPSIRCTPLPTVRCPASVVVTSVISISINVSALPGCSFHNSKLRSSSPQKTRLRLGLQLAPSCLVSFLWLHFCVLAPSAPDLPGAILDSRCLGTVGLAYFIKSRARGTASGRTANRSSFLAFR